MQKLAHAVTWIWTLQAALTELDPLRGEHQELERRKIVNQDTEEEMSVKWTHPVAES